MSYRPITDLWLLARPKVKFYGAYPNGFLERARVLMGVHRNERMLHVCGGHAKQYPAWQKLCPSDYTLDLDATTAPSFLADAREELPLCPPSALQMLGGTEKPTYWPALIADPPYTEADADKYTPTRDVFPSAGIVLRRMLAAVCLGGRVGMLHYVLPQPPREGVKFVACVGVIAGYNNRMRCFSVFERTA